MLAEPLAGQHEIEVVMRQQDGRQPCVGVGTVGPGPGQLGCGIAGQDRVARERDGAAYPTHGVHDLRAFGRGAGVAPQLGRRQHLACRIHRHEPMLLAGDRHRDDACAQRGIDPGETIMEGRYPIGGRLLAAAVGRAVQREQRAGGGGHRLRLRVVDQHLQALRPCIDPCNQTHRNRLRSTKGSANIPWTQKGRAVRPLVATACVIACGVSAL